MEAAAALALAVVLAVASILPPMLAPFHHSSSVGRTMNRYRRFLAASASPLVTVGLAILCMPPVYAAAYVPSTRHSRSNVPVSSDAVAPDATAVFMRHPFFAKAVVHYNGKTVARVSVRSYLFLFSEIQFFLEPLNSGKAKKTYLKKFGYLQSIETADVTLDVDMQSFREALKTLQKFASLPSTGKLDEETIEVMNRPRCSVEDDDLNVVMSPHLRRSMVKSRRFKRHSIEGSYWTTNDITYQIRRYSKELDSDTIDHIIEKSFKVWEEYSPLKFRQVYNDHPHIEIAFVSGNHGDGEPFDGRGGILAHAFFPRYGGDVHFDHDEPWRDPDTRGIDLYSVAAHEIGHSLGLKHSRNLKALMAPLYQPNTGEDIHLHPDDVKALQLLYGRPNEYEKRKMYKVFFGPLKSKVTPELYKLEQYNICDDPSIDAITVIGNGSTYAFKNDWYWRLNQVSYDAGYPRKISADWDGLPNHLDAATTDQEGNTYFFKGNLYWLYDKNGQRIRGYPKKISEGLVDMPNNIDAAMTWSYDKKPYFFKGNLFWQYSPWGLQSSWPMFIQSISSNLPQRIDAAFLWNNGKNYLFAGQYYYKLSSWRVMKALPGYPRWIGDWWFGCTKSENIMERNSIATNYTDK